MFHAAIYENSQPAGIGVLEIVSEESAQGTPGPTRGFVPLQRSELRGEIVGPFATLQLRQIFGYTRADSPQTVEALYRFPLPGDAAVTQVTVHFGEVAIVATLQMRAAAEAEYAEAKAAGRQAALATREAADVFTLQLAGLQPDQAITVETDYIQLARSEGTKWSLRVPLTTAPRYTRGDERGTRPAAGQPLALMRDPGHRFALDLQMRKASAISSPTHAVAITETNGDSQVVLQGGATIPDRDFVLHWAGPQAQETPHLALTSQPAADGQRYFLAQVAPPSQASQPPLPREVILLVDHSGSMSGPKWAAADWAVERFLGDLQEIDSFALGVFHNNTHWFAPQLQGATSQTVTNAIHWLKQNTDSGGTELGVALEQALRMARIPGEAARHVLILTDAAVTDGDRILRLADQEQAVNPKRRINVICIDAAPNAFLAQELAERGGGIAKFLTSDPQQQDITTALDEVLAAWVAPIAVNLQLVIHDRRAELGDQHALRKRTEGTTIVDLGDLMAGQPRWMIGRLPQTSAESVQVDLRLADDSLLAQSQITLPPQAASTNLRALFGARRVNGLEYLVNAGLPPEQVAAQLTRLGYDPALVLGDHAPQTPPIYAENARQQLLPALRRLLAQEALRYGLASTETAFVATRQEAGQPVQAQVAVANALPAGWAEGFATRGSVAGASPMVRSMAAMSMPAAMPAPARHLKTGLGKRAVPQSMATGAPPGASSLPMARGISNGGGEAIVFHGEVTGTAGEIVLYPAAQQATLPADITLTGIALRLLSTTENHPASAPELAQQVDRHVVIQLFIGDLASPRARIRLQDLLRYGARPLNLYRAADELVQIQLVDPAGWLQDHPLRFELVLQW